MKILKIILTVLAIIIAIPLIAALFMKKEYTIEREVTINKPKQEVFNYIKNLKNQNNYNIWWMKDPNAQKEFRGTDGTVGFVAAWNSKDDELGQGEQEIKKVTEGERIDCEIRFVRPFENTALTAMSVAAVSETQTKVKWTFAGVSKYPMNMMNPMMDNFLGGHLQQSMANLKSEIEK